MAAALLVACGAAHSATDAEIGRWIDELVGSALTLQELASQPCRGLVREERIEVAAWYSWAASLGSASFRVQAENRKAVLLAEAAQRARQWLQAETRRWPAERLQTLCSGHAGIFHTIRAAAEAELEDIEYRQRGRVTPRSERTAR